MDPFQHLPVHILELVLGFLPDLSTLYHLHNASPAVASVLHIDGVAPFVIEAILVQSELPRETQALIRTAALLRWSASTGLINTASENPLPSSLAEFKKSYS